jgi:hypothetical protein
MRNTHVVEGWTLTPAISRSAYDTGHEVCTVTKVERGRDGDGYHVESPNGMTFYVSFWDDDRSWRSQTLTGAKPCMCLAHPSSSLKDLIDKLQLVEEIKRLRDRAL